MKWLWIKGLMSVLAGSALAFASAAWAEEATSFKIVAKAGKFEPATLEVPAGKKLTLEVVNEGASAIEFESKDLKQEKVIAAGKSVKITLNPLKAGTYRFVDEYHEATAKGTLVAK